MKRKLAVEGVIVVTFRPPVPDDLGSDLLFKIRDWLGAEVSAAADEEHMSWGFDIRIKNVTRLQESAERVAQFFKRRKGKRPRVSQIEIGRHYGPIELSVPRKSGTAADVSGLLPQQEPALTASVFIGITRHREDFDQLTADVRKAIGRVGTLADAYSYKAIGGRFELNFPNAFRAPSRIAAVLEVLQQYKVPRSTTVTVVLDTPTQRIPL